MKHRKRFVLIPMILVGAVVLLPSLAAAPERDTCFDQCMDDEGNCDMCCEICGVGDENWRTGCLATCNPAIDMEKYVSVDDGYTWHDADTPQGPEVLLGSETVWFKFIVTNDGDVVLSNVTLSDSDFDAVIASVCTVPSELNIGESFECVIGPFVAIECQHTNTATATGDYGGQPSSDSDHAHYLGSPCEVPVELAFFGARADGGSILLTWTTGSETENLGYNVYRCLTKDGKYEKLTAELIEGAGSSRTTQTYQFIDEDVQVGKAYFYKLEQIDFDGAKKMHGPVAVTVSKTTAVEPSTWGLIKSLLK
jgi:hypothetical protein